MPRPVNSSDDQPITEQLDVERRRLMQAIGGIGVASVAIGNVGAEEDYQPPPEEEWPERVEPGAEGLWTEPPADATYLWNGDDATLDGWEKYSDGSEPEWNEYEDYFEWVAGTGDIQTEEPLGDFHLHLEWRSTEDSDGQQPWANSGVFTMQRYEHQVLCDYNDPSAASPSGAYYSQQPGMIHAVRPPNVWNEYDLIWRAPRWEDGELVRPAQTTLFFNGAVVLSQLDIEGMNAPEYPHLEYEEHPAELPLRLQEYGNNEPIQFRNVWYRDLPDESTYQETGSAVTWEHPESLHGTNEYTKSPGGTGTTGEQPEDAGVLFGENGLEAWERPNGEPAGWNERDGYVAVEPGAGDIQTKEVYGDCQLHLEYRIPEDVEGEGPGRGSSGVLMMDNYEINIVDTWDNPVEPDEWAGAYTHQNEPHHDSARQPGEWQHLDLVWRAPRFEDEYVSQPAQVTAFLNGVAVQTRLEIHGPNDENGIGEYEVHAEQPLRLREDDSEVHFRNTWIREFTTDDLVDPEVQEVPYGLDAGGEETDGDVVIDGMRFDRSPDDSEYVSLTSGTQTSAPPNPEELEFEGTEHDLLYASEINGAAPGAEATVPVVGSEVSAYVTENDLGEAGSVTEEDYGHFGFEIDAPYGRYELTLHFSDWPYMDPEEDARIQDVYVQDELVLEAFQCEPGVAQPKTFEVEVTDGPLTIDLEVHPDSQDPNAKINGLELHRIEEPLWKGAE